MTAVSPLPSPGVTPEWERVLSVTDMLAFLSRRAPARFREDVLQEAHLEAYQASLVFQESEGIAFTTKTYQRAERRIQRESRTMNGGISARMLKADYIAPMSLEAQWNGITVGETLESAEDISYDVCEAEQVEWLYRQLQAVCRDEVDQRIIAGLVLLSGEGGWQSAVALELGLTRQAVSKRFTRIRTDLARRLDGIADYHYSPSNGKSKADLKSVEDEADQDAIRPPECS